MLIKQTKEMTEAERLAAQNSNNQFLQALAYSAVGTIFPYAGESAPDTFMLCDGSELNVAQYPKLFSVIGYKFGGSEDIFKLPDLKGRTLIGVDGSDEKFNTVGKSGGEANHTLTIDEMPSHNHDFIRNDGRKTTYGWGHGEAHTGVLAEVATVNSEENYVITQTGNGQPHNNMPPFTVINYIIKVVQSIPEIDMRLPIDQTYSSESENAQSGIAVAEAVSGKADVDNWRLVKTVTLTEAVRQITLNYYNLKKVRLFITNPSGSTGNFDLTILSPYNLTYATLFVRKDYVNAYVDAWIENGKMFIEAHSGVGDYTQFQNYAKPCSADSIAELRFSANNGDFQKDTKIEMWGVDV